MVCVTSVFFFNVSPLSALVQTISTNILKADTENIIKDIPWSSRLRILNFNRIQASSRQGTIEALQFPEASQDDSQNPQVSNDDDNDMKLKLFRLMYEMIKESDVKVRRADEVKSSYTNSTSFEIGFLLGDITDKHSIMQDIALTMKRMYEEWKPIEHVNAYEQIAHQAIEINHLVDMVRALHKKNTDKLMLK